MGVSTIMQDTISTNTAVVGQIVSGRFGDIYIRQKSSTPLELGQLLVSDSDTHTLLYQVVDLLYASQMQEQTLHLIAGMNLEENEAPHFMGEELRNYTLARVKLILSREKSNARSNTPKSLPPFFSTLRNVIEADLSFITKPAHPLYLGQLRSGSNTIGIDIFLAGKDVLSHHVLVPATTGKGKSNLLRVVLWNATPQDYASFVVFDPHNEYYGHHGFGLKDHPSKHILYVSQKTQGPQSLSLTFHIEELTPKHFSGAAQWSDAQQDCMQVFYRKHYNTWIETLLLADPDDVQKEYNIHPASFGVVKRRLENFLSLSSENGVIIDQGIFSSKERGKTTLHAIAKAAQDAKTIIIDTSLFAGATEIIINSLVTSYLLDTYQKFARNGELADKPVVSLVIEEAPRVLGKDVLKAGPNVFSEIAREGRKFKIGLFAITQLPSLLPKTILANMNTKIILGIEMAPERQAVIESAAQDLSDDNRTIASLDKGEALVTSNFARFAIPLKIPFFDTYKEKLKEEQALKQATAAKRDFSAFAGMDNNVGGGGL